MRSVPFQFSHTLFPSKYTQLYMYIIWTLLQCTYVCAPLARGLLGSPPPTGCPAWKQSLDSQAAALRYQGNMESLECSLSTRLQALAASRAVERVNKLKCTFTYSNNNIIGSCTSTCTCTCTSTVQPKIFTGQIFPPKTVTLHYSKSLPLN